MPAALELVLSDVRGPTNATRSQFDVIKSRRARLDTATLHCVNTANGQLELSSPYYGKKKKNPK
jgi:hypothetical protein